MKPGENTELSTEQRQEIVAWFAANSALLPESVRDFLALHQKYLAAEGDARKLFDSAWRELRRALGITPSSEKRPSGLPLSAIPQDKGCPPKSEREKLEEQIGRSDRLGDWHGGLNTRHQSRAKRLKEKLANMPTERTGDGKRQEVTEDTRLEDIELTQEEQAQAKAGGKRFVEHLLRGDGADPVLRSVNETLMPGGAVLANQEHVSLAATVPVELADATVVKTMSEQRVRYDFSVTVTRIELEVEKKVVVNDEGERHVITASTHKYGPPRFSVTWSALSTLAVLVGQFALPYHRLATMLSSAGKRFTAGSLSRMLHYVAQRLLPIYLELAEQLSDCEVLAGDDTSCRVLEVSAHFAKSKADPESKHKDKPPWADYQTPSVAQKSLRRCEETKRERVRRREEGDRDAKRTPDETPSLGVLIGRRLDFESPRRNGDGAKQSMNTTVVSGRGVSDDPQSLIILYRSHLGGCGNLFESVLTSRDPKLRDVILQGDLSTTNLVTSPELLTRLDIRSIGCSAHARRPFANYEHEDPVHCSYMLHLFLGLAIHEQRLDVHGRNRDNVLAVRGAESRDLWNQILELAKTMADSWSQATKLGAAARYIVKHFDKLTAYLDDPRLEPTNNLRERMLRMEKLIEGSSMFRQSLEGRFVLDVVRTILQTAVAAGVPVHQYILSVLQASDDDVAQHPDRYTPRAWAATNSDTNAAADMTPTH